MIVVQKYGNFLLFWYWIFANYSSGHLPRCSNELRPHFYFFSLELFKSILLFHVCKEHIWYTFQVTSVLVYTEVLLDFVSWNHLKVIWWERYQKKLRTWYCWNSLIKSELVPWNFEVEVIIFYTELQRYVLNDSKSSIRHTPKLST